MDTGARRRILPILFLLLGFVAGLGITILLYEYTALRVSPRMIYTVSSRVSTRNRTKFRIGRGYLKYKPPPVTWPAAPEVDLISCEKVFRQDARETAIGHLIESDKLWTYENESYYVDLASNCTRFRTVRQYVLEPLSMEEADFTIAYAFMIFKDLEYFERLFRSVYHPQNLYCVHVDIKSSPLYYTAVSQIISCFPNAFIARRRVNVQWGKFSALEPIKECMKELLAHKKKWKYFINLTGQEFPLRTNRELVQILTAYNGANDIMGVRFKRKKLKFITLATNVRGRYFYRPLPDLNLTFAKGEAHLVASHAFVNYTLHDPRALAWWRYLAAGEHTCTPCVDEYYFQSLAHSPQLGVPGAYTGVLPDERHDDFDYMIDTRKTSLVRWKNWWGRRAPCTMEDFKHWMCVINLSHLHLLRDSKHYFVNKFTQGSNPLAYNCLETWFYKRVHAEMKGLSHFDTTFHKNLPFVTNKYVSDEYT